MSADESPVNRARVDEALSRFLDGEPEPGDAEVLAAAVREDPEFAQELRQLLAVDDLLRQAHEPDPAAFTEAVETRLAAEGSGDAFTRAVLAHLAGPADPGPPPGRPVWRRPALWAAVAAAALLAGGLWLALRGPAGPGEAGADVAWLNNAQDCRWAPGGAPSGGLGPGKVLQLEQGLAEIRFPSGAGIVLQGPATLEIRSATSVRLVRGRLTARVPEAARGFEVLSPEGKVVDLGTEFGLSVGDDGSARVHVFRGEVLAHPAGNGSAAPVSVRERQSARISTGGVSLQPPDAGADGFVREIVPQARYAPRALALDFRRPVAGTLADREGRGCGMSHRLPGTGRDLPAPDPNLLLDPAAGRLQLTTTENDLNQQYKVGQGEYVGVRLSDLGFTGAEDFSVTAVFPSTPVLDEVDQIGLYAGTRSDRHVRGGLMRPGGNKGLGPSTQFFVGNNGGNDANLYMVGMVATGVDLVMTLKRIGGKYSLVVENQTTGESAALTIRHPEFLDGERDLYVGLFGATPWRNVPRTISVKEFRATVWVRR